MKLVTKYHGKIEVSEKDVIFFEHGIPGFLKEKHFFLLELEKDSPFLILQSKTTPELGFVLMSPFDFYKNYEFELLEQDKKHLTLNHEEDILVFTILTVKEPFEETTANLKAPLVINKSNNKAKQIILNDSNYETRHKVFQTVEQK
ncbi:flagellar assembly protein FliW [Metabacillus endolithicus]|uniref:Flagellar assembly factor FliW n=1 Tax=Metabacillus endolithicus TaxID=1535204 RepID=A0ABW5BZK3_9BACI